MAAQYIGALDSVSPHCHALKCLRREISRHVTQGKHQGQQCRVTHVQNPHGEAWKSESIRIDESTDSGCLGRSRRRIISAGAGHGLVKKRRRQVSSRLAHSCVLLLFVTRSSHRAALAAASLRFDAAWGDWFLRFSSNPVRAARQVGLKEEASAGLGLAWIPRPPQRYCIVDERQLTRCSAKQSPAGQGTSQTCITYTPIYLGT